jgi:hypothetical protein
MKPSWRSDAAGYLAAFVASHRGLRSGRLFGQPVAYAGRRLFASACEDGIAAKLPPDALEVALQKGGAAKWKRGWVIFRLADASAAHRIGPFLEVAARHAARFS